jgi:esterase/lipase superfamily enzyme
MNYHRSLLLVLLALVLTGCQESLITTPYAAYGDAGREAFSRTPDHLRTTDIPVLYVTDRAAPSTSDRGPEYTYARSPYMTYGIASVSLNTSATWDDLVEDSTRAERTHSYAPRVATIEERGRFLPTIQRLGPSNGRLAPKPGAYEEFERELEQFHTVLSTYLDHTDRKEAVLFIHGYNNSFDSAVLRLAEAWHFCGRQGVPIVYSWPAGSGGLKGYAYDRESGEFSIVHLKVLLMALAKCPQLEKIHIISHSRGTDVAITALRELHNECRGVLGTGIISNVFNLPPPPSNGAPPRTTADVLKIETLILAAPDLDLDVFAQRFFGENLLAAARRTAIYFSKDDDAIGLSDWLFRSRRRLGALRLEDLKPDIRAVLPQLDNLQLINCKVSGYTSHSYILQHPAALSDLILLIREQRPPGAESGRPLTVPFPGVFELDNSYLKPTP